MRAADGSGMADDPPARRTVIAIPAKVMLSPAEVAELLGFSHLFVIRLLDQGAIRSDYLPNSSRRQIHPSDVLAFQSQRERRAEGRCRIADIAASAELPY
jgi:hypothetical protein